MNYATGYSFNSKEIFENFQLNKLKTENKNLNGKRRDTLILSIFTYAIKLILSDVFEYGYSFKLPSIRESKIEMKGLFNEDFKKARRNKKFLEIDYYKTDFSAYTPTFIYYSKGVRLEKPIHVSKNLQKIFIDNTNNGFKFFNKTVTVSDYIDRVNEKYPEFYKSDIKKILNFGWKSIYLINVYGGDTLIKDNQTHKYLFYIGKLTFNTLKHIKYYKYKMITKLRILYNRRKPEFQKCYYFGLNKNNLALFLDQYKKKNKKYVLNDIFLYKMLDECKLYNDYYLIFKVVIEEDLGFKIYKNKYETRNIELVYGRNDNGYESINNSKQYINELLKRNVYNI